MDRFCLECNKKLILKQKKFCSILCRRKGEHLYKERFIMDLDEETHQILEGLLLSDGSLEMGKTHRYPRLVVSQSEDHLQYLEFLADKFKLGRDRITPRAKYHNKLKKYYKSYVLATKTSPVLESYYKRWYPNGTKVVPIDFKITPISLLHMYLGDGCLNGYVSNKKYGKQLYYRVILYLMNFNQEAVENLVLALSNLGVEANCLMIRHKGYAKSYPIIRFGRKKSLSNFFKYLYKNEVQCYNYKFNCTFA